MHKKYFFFDIDGTLSTGLTTMMPESAVKALAQLRANGHFTAIISITLISPILSLTRITERTINTACKSKIFYWTQFHSLKRSGRIFDISFLRLG